MYRAGKSNPANALLRRPNYVDLIEVANRLLLTLQKKLFLFLALIAALVIKRRRRACNCIADGSLWTLPRLFNTLREFAKNLLTARSEDNCAKT